MKKKSILLLLLPFLMIGIIVFLIVNSFYGNPVSKLLVKLSSQKYLKENFDTSELYIDSVVYNFKSGNYYANVVSKESSDTHFSIYTDKLGRIRFDDFSDRVLSGWNTSIRLQDEYRNLVASVLDSGDFPYESDIAFGELLVGYYSVNGQEINTLNMSDLILDKKYDIKNLGKEYGHLVIYVDSNEVSEEKAAEILLDIKDIFDHANVPFYSVDFTLEMPRDVNADGRRPGDSINLIYFLAEDIYEEGMVERVHEARIAADAYYKKRKEKKLPKK